MKLVNTLASALAFALCVVAPTALAQLHHMDDSYCAWSVDNTVQDGDHFSTTWYSWMRVCLRAYERGVGPITPSGNVYTVAAGADPNNSALAKWDFQWVAHWWDGNGWQDLDTLTIQIDKIAGTNNGPGLNGGTTRLVAVRGSAWQQNNGGLSWYPATHWQMYTGNPNQAEPGGSGDWWHGASHGYLLGSETFAYRFVLVGTKGVWSVTTTMCVRTGTLTCE